MASSISSTPNHDDFGEDDVRLDLESLKKLSSLLHPSSGLNTPDQILDDKSRAFFIKLLVEATEQTLRRRDKILPTRRLTPLENPSSSKISDQRKEFQHGFLNPKPYNYSPVPAFQRQNSNRTFKSQFSLNSRQNQPCIGNRAPISRSIIAPNQITKTEEKHKEKVLSGYNTAESNRRNYNRMKGNKVKPVEMFEERGLGFKEERDERAPHVRRQIPNKGKVKEVLSDSDSCSGSSYDSYSSSSTGSLQKPKLFAERPESSKKLSKRPSTSRRNSKNPMNPKRMPSHHDKMPSHHDNDKHLIKSPSHKIDDKAHIKVQNHDNKTLGKVSNHNNDNTKAFDKMPSHKTDNKAFVKMPSHHDKKPLNKISSHRNKAPSHHMEAGPSKKTHEKSPEKKNNINNNNKKKESGFKKLKDKLAVVFHHHHHHRHEVIPPAQHHRSPWKFLKGIVHKPSERAAEIAPHHHPHLRKLFRDMVDQLHLNWKKNKDGRNKKKKNKVGNKGRKNKKLHWWNKWKKGGGVKLANGKKTRGRVKMGWRKGSGKKKGGKR